MGIGEFSTDAHSNMKLTSVYSQANITQAGSRAHECFRHGSRGKVVAAFSKAIYWPPNDGELFWIATEDSPMHRRCAQISSALPRTQASSPFRVDHRRLIMESGFTFHMDSSAS